MEHGKQVYAKEIRNHIADKKLSKAKEMLMRYSCFFFKTEIRELAEEIIEKSIKEKLFLTSMKTLKQFRFCFKTKKQVRILAGKMMTAAIKAKEKNLADWMLLENIDVFNETQIKYFEHKIEDI